jgi:Ca2+-binding RTX toxin-like protein
MNRLPVLVAAALAATALVLPYDAAQAAPYTCDGHPATIVGTSGDDHLVGTDGADVIVALGGDDRIEAGRGDDVVCGLAGSDEIDAGPGDDRVFAGIDRWNSDRGGENRVGDTVWPGPGRDYVDLGADSRPVTGYGQRDTLVYRTVDDAIHADLSPGVGRVKAEGLDTVRVHGEMGVVGSRFADTIIGGPRGDSLVGGWGDDVIEGRGGDDWIRPDYYDKSGKHDDDDVVRAGAGADELSSTSGADVILGGPGDDFFDLRDNPDVTADAGPGNDGISAFARPLGAVDLDGGPGSDYVFLWYRRSDHLPHGTVDMRDGSFVREGIPGADAVPGRMAGFEDIDLDRSADWRVYGTDSADVIAGADEVWSYGGDDKVYATGGPDYVDAGDGDDLVWAYEGKDTCLNAEHRRDCEVTTAG